MKVTFLVLMEALVHQKKGSVLVSVKQRQNVAWVWITMVIIVNCFLMVKKSISLKLVTKMLTFQLDFS